MHPVEDANCEGGSANFSVENLVDDRLNPSLSFSRLHVRRGEEDLIFVCGKTSLMCAEIDSDLSLPRLIRRFGSIIVIGAGNQAAVIGVCRVVL